MSVGKRIAGVILFFLIGIGMFLGVQEVLTPDWSSVSADMTIRGFSAIEDNSIDILFLDPSTVVNGISPMKLYEDTGICSYSLATAAQTIEESYHLAKKAFQNQSPSIVILETSPLYYPEKADYNASWRYVLDNLNMDAAKIDMLKTYDTMWYSDGWETILFPIIKYHTRWNVLTKDDFRTKPKLPLYTAGSFVGSSVKATDKTLYTLNEIADNMTVRNTGKIVYYDKLAAKDITEETITSDLYAPDIADRHFDYLNKIYKLCCDNDAKLILIKIPSLTYPQLNSTAWTEMKSKHVKGIAQNYDIPFYDFMYDYNIINYKEDTVDQGQHLNIRGAEKITQALSEILVEDWCEVFPLNRLNNNYNEMLENYQKVRTVAMLQSETDFNRYIDCLKANLSDWTVFVIGSDEFTHNLTEKDYIQLKQNLTLQLVDSAEYTDAYMAVIKNSEVVYEAVSNRRINHNLSVNDQRVQLIASGWYSGPLASIKIGGIEHAVNVRGLNFVVVDNTAGLVIDSVSFNTFQAEHPAIRKENIYNYLYNYESKVCSSQ